MEKLEKILMGLLFLFMVLNIVDLVLTVKGLSRGLKDRNPFFTRELIVRTGVMKLVAGIVLSYGLHELYDYIATRKGLLQEVLLLAGLFIVNGYYVYVVLRNLKILGLI